MHQELLDLTFSELDTNAKFKKIFDTLNPQLQEYIIKKYSSKALKEELPAELENIISNYLY